MLWLISRWIRHCHSRGNKVHTNGHILCWDWEGAKTVTCPKRSTNFHQMEEEAIASTLEGTKIAICRKVDRSCPLRMVGSGQVGVSSGLSDGAHCENWQGNPGNVLVIASCTYSVSSIWVFMRKSLNQFEPQFSWGLVLFTPWNNCKD